MTFVIVVDNENKAVKKQIEIGFDDGNRVEILGVLTENDRVVTAGKSSLKTDTLVKVVEPIT
jgi:multidrug efflux pump subunit AcrA (membrane-fusion protein)